MSTPDTHRPSRPFIGHGVGLRTRHYGHALTHGLEVDWFEACTENFLGGGGRPMRVLERLRRDLPVVFHGVSLGIGSIDPPPRVYLEQILALFARFEPAWVSDHLAWCRVGGHQAEDHMTHALLPLPYNEASLKRVAERIDFVQEFLGRPLLLENPSSYVSYHHSDIHEADFLDELCRRTGGRIMLDINNIVVSARNHSFDARDYIRRLTPSHVWQFHLANHTDMGHYKFDDHRGAVQEAVWSLHAFALQHLGPVSSLVEWDSDVPPWPELRAQRDEAAMRSEAVLGLDERRAHAQGKATLA
ncbi:MAG: DUF692 domain-containing protein [Nannocystaceae bacterium]